MYNNLRSKLNIGDTLLGLGSRAVGFLRQGIYSNRIIFEWIGRSTEETSGYGYSINSTGVSFVANDEGYNDLVSSLGGSNTQYVTTSNFNRSNGQDLGISVWVRPTTLGSYHSIVSSRDTTLFSWILYIHATGNKVSLHGNLQNPGSYTIQPNVWTHIVANVENIAGTQYSKIYINGVLVDTLANYSYQPQSPTRLLIGDTNGTERFIGNIKLLRIFSGPLTIKEINKLYMEGKGLLH